MGQLNTAGRELTHADLTARNSGLYDLTNLVVHIIGCGAIGSFTASTFARMGVTIFDLFDDDIVAPENIGVQDFTFMQLGMDKVTAVAQNIKSINPNARVMRGKIRVGGEDHLMRGGSHNLFHGIDPSSLDTRRHHNPISLEWSHVIIMAVDSMESRLKIAQNKNLGIGFKESFSRNRKSNNPACFYDARMGSETFQLYKFPLPLVLKDYMDTWYSDEDGDSEPCSARATAYCSTLAGSMIASEIKKNESGGLSAERVVFNFPSLLLDSTTDFSKLTQKTMQ